MAEATVNGWRIVFDDVGPREAPPVLLIHGLLMDRTMFAPQVEALSDRWRFVVPDVRNHGESEHRSGETYTQWDLMEDGVALLDHLGIERAVWGGVSQGGFQSLRAALRHPERVAGLVLIDTAAGPEDPDRGAIYEAAAVVGAEEGWSEDVLAGAVIAMFGSDLDDDLRRHWVGRWVAQPREGAVERMHAVTRRDDVTERLSHVSQPALVIHGEDDFAIEIELAELLCRHLSDCRGLVRVPKAGHSSTVENPEPITTALEGFLTEVWPV
jgi:pimeloyl-ACP methyl ester carboxylesterase